MALHRVVLMTDGWFPQADSGPALDEAKALVAQGAGAAGRDPDRLGLEGVVSCTEAGATRVLEETLQWEQAGAAHVSIDTMRASLGSEAGHLAALAESAADLGRRPA